MNAKDQKIHDKRYPGRIDAARRVIDVWSRPDPQPWSADRQMPADEIERRRLRVNRELAGVAAGLVRGAN